MRTLLLLLVMPLLINVAPAQDTISISFDPDEMHEITCGIPNPALLTYLVLETDIAFIGGYECSIHMLNPTVHLVDASGPAGWTNFGDDSNHLVGFATPLPVEGDFAVLCTLTLNVTEDDTACLIEIWPSEPCSFVPPAPGFADGDDPDVLIPCLGGWGILDPCITPTRSQTLGDVKALFH